MQNITQAWLSIQFLPNFLKLYSLFLKMPYLQVYTIINIQSSAKTHTEECDERLSMKWQLCIQRPFDETFYILAGTAPRNVKYFSPDTG